MVWHALLSMSCFPLRSREDFLVDPAHGDFDTVGYFYCLTPEGERIDLNRFYTEKSGKMVSISHKEYDTLKAQAVVKQ